MLRGHAVEEYNIVEYFVHTYEEDMETRYKDQDNEVVDKMTDEHRGPGRKRNERILYLPNHPKYGKKLRIKRSRGHNQLPNFIGRFFPRADDPDIREFYCACMLLLLKPWRSICTDLKHPTQSWEEAFNTFLSHTSKHTKDMISGIQYFYEARAAAEDEREREEEVDDDLTRCEKHHGLDEQDDYELGEDAHITDDTFTEEGLAELTASQVPLREELHGRLAVERAKHAKIFNGDNRSWDLDNGTVIGNATGDELTKLLHWRKQLGAAVNAQNQRADSSQQDGCDDMGSVTRLYPAPSNDSENRGQVELMIEDATSEQSLSAADPQNLKPDQYRAYDIITWHLEQTIAGKKPPPLRMIIHGEGGTGKSKVIQTVTQYFIKRGAKHLLLKAAYTGVAASLIDGKTTHVIGMISTSGRPMSDETKAKLQQFWKYIVYLIIDEISMISKSFLAILSRHIGIGKGTRDTPICSQSFGGINVVFCGDFHQFPPVACAVSEALYQPSNMVTDSLDSQLGRAIYEEFSTVVILREQLRVTDNVWRDLLTHLRYGRIQERHLTVLRKQLIKHPNSSPTDFSSEPWNTASLVTPRHAVRTQWNEAAIRKHCYDTKQRLFICPAEDRINGRQLMLAERYGVVNRSVHKGGRQRSRRSSDLPDAVELAVGMRVMVTANIETDLDVTNGARGEIVDIILHPDEPPLGDDSIVKLKHLPSYILIKMQRTHASQLDGLDEGIIPVEVTTRNFQIKVRTNGGKYVTRSVRRRQFPMTAAYAFTDYRSQGQTLPYVMIDIAKPPTGALDLFNLYVALSRSSGRESIRLLRDFDDELFKKSHHPALLAEDDRLDKIDRITKAWWCRMRDET